jgi:hypothetical protein
MQWFTCAVCALVFAFCIVKTLHWQIVWDQSVIRYVRFLMSRGLRPYSDITDMNMPGSYMMEALGMAVFGWSDLSWRIYESVLIGVLAVSGMVIGGRRYWLTGVYGATIFVLVRFTDGEGYSLERNEIMGVLSVLGLALFFVALRSRKPALIALSSGLICLAATMKPGGFLLELLLLGLLTITLRREGVPLRPYLLWTSAGIAFGCALMIGFLAYTHAIRGFFFIIFKVWPLFRAMSPQKTFELQLVPKFLIPSTLLAALAAYKQRAVMRWERWAFLLAMVYGAVSYKLEGGEARYHRYVFLAILATWIGWELTLALSGTDTRSRLIGVAGLVLLLGLVVPNYVVHVRKVAYASPALETYPAALQSDLASLGGQRLQGQVECLEMVDGCLRTLYEMRLVQNTGSTGDLLLFTSRQSPAVAYYRNWYTNKQANNPANVIVLGNFWFEADHRSFDRIDTWPQYADYLRSHYVLLVERRFGDGDAPGYRIYVRKGSGLLPAAKAQG